MKKLFAEFFGTFWLVFGGCGSAVFSAAYPELYQNDGINLILLFLNSFEEMFWHNL